MSFEEVAARYAELRQEYDAGRLTEASYAAAVHALRFQDQNGVLWQIHPATGQWIRWDGRAWVPASAEPATTPPAAASTAARSGLARRLLSWNEPVWNVISIVAGIAMGAAWWAYSDIAGEPDKWTAGAMAGLPLGLVLLRRPIDLLLRPLQRIKRRVPPMLLVGIGLAVPLLVSNFFYLKVYGGNTSGNEYEFMFWTFLTSVLVSYVVLRTPRTRRAAPDQRRSP